MKPNMTHREVAQDLRARGYRISEAAVSKNIQAGIFPFGTVINRGVSGRVTTLILRTAYERWADENIGPILAEH